MAKKEKKQLSDGALRKLCIKLIEERGCCQKCGIINDTLQCHHIVFRSTVRIDTEENLIVLCYRCHRYAQENFKSGELWSDSYMALPMGAALSGKGGELKF